MRIPAAFLSFAILLGAPLLRAQETSESGETRGAHKIGGTSKGSPASGYGRKWALIVGVNYLDEMGDDKPKRSAADRLVLPELKNAESDATSLLDLLVQHYGYQPPAGSESFEKDQTTVLLKGAAATEEAIKKALERLTEKDLVQENDSVVVFFAGHGGRLDGVAIDRGAIYPFDVIFANGRPLSRRIGLHSDLVSAIKRSPARHRLIILDSCHSGEIFNLQARPRSETDDRSSPQLFAEPTIQAIASCRATQVASDGKDGNSPFTGALLQALRQLPSRDYGKSKSPIWTNRLFRYMRAELSSLPNGQSPDCRCLSDDDGEFYFYPGGDFSEYAGNATDFRLLQAMVPGEHGNWWFDETPWFMPSLRRIILAEMPAGRSSLDSIAISGDRLRELGESAMATMRSQVEKDGETDTKTSNRLVKIRLRHFEQFLRGENGKGFDKQVEQVVNDLTPLQESLEPTDIHFLAVAQHRLRRPEALDTYQKALSAYETFSDEGQVRHRKALMALCLSDRGQFLLDIKQDAAAAALDFERARTLFDSGAPAAFRVYVLCREADSWQRRNLWGVANRKLLEALDVANNFDAQHGLTAFVHRRRAWALMEQWRIREAEASFEKANEILTRLARTGDTAGEPATFAADSDAKEPASQVLAERDDDALVQSDDFDGMIAYLHNLHGLAMARRFQGDGDAAVEDYRSLSGKLAQALARLRQGSASARISTSVESRLVERMVNTLERLGDCNLFGNPEQIDIKEAIDDYRRALSLCHLLPNGDRTRIGLLSKRALSLSLPSPYQDAQLAQAYCREAVSLQKEHLKTVAGVERTLSEITPALIALYASPDRNASPATATERDGEAAEDTARESLRKVILEARNRIGQNIHRDQLELLLFASRNLLEQIPESERFHLAEDAETLLSLCRLALPHHIGRAAGLAEYHQESREYLRPFYDAVLRAKLRLKGGQVSELLEIHWEATRGELYVKHDRNNPVLAIYVLDNKCHVFFDVPRGTSKSFCLDEDVGPREIQKACALAEARLPLPREVTRELDRLLVRSAAQDGNANGHPECAVECWWEDPVRSIGKRRPTRITVAGSRQYELPLHERTPSSFPFVLPSSLRALPRPIESAVEQIADRSRGTTTSRPVTPQPDNGSP